MFHLQNTLEPVPNETMMIVRLGRALKPGEFRAKLSHLEIHKPQFFKSVLDSIIVKGMTVRQFKEQIVKELYEQAVDIPLNVSALHVLNTTDSISRTLYSRIRLRKKTWRSPATIFLDSQVFDRDIRVFANYEMYIECLDGEWYYTKLIHYNNTQHTCTPLARTSITPFTHIMPSNINFMHSCVHTYTNFYHYQILIR